MCVGCSASHGNVSVLGTSDGAVSEDDFAVAVLIAADAETAVVAVKMLSLTWMLGCYR